MYRVFISYRRSDSESFSGRLRDRLRTEFGKRAIFMDTSTIPGGAKFDEAIAQNLKSCTVFVAVIGKSWLDCKNDAGQRRLDDPGDWVRKEVAQALTRDDLLVIPVIFGGATMPGSEALPADLQPLARRNAVSINDADFDSDVVRLIEACQPHVPKPRRWPWLAGAAAALLAIVGAWFWTHPGDEGSRGVYLIPDRGIYGNLPLVEGNPGRKRYSLSLSTGKAEWRTDDLARKGLYIVSDSALDDPGGSQDIGPLESELARHFQVKGARDYAMIAARLSSEPIKVMKLRVRAGATLTASLDEVITDSGQTSRKVMARCKFLLPESQSLSDRIFYIAPASRECQSTG